MVRLDQTFALATEAVVSFVSFILKFNSTYLDSYFVLIILLVASITFYPWIQAGEANIPVMHWSGDLLP